jgi:glycosyltransferase involved in cell wall biosynthesis
MHISNFRPVKRVRDVVRIFARVRRELPSVLVMVGDGPDRVHAEAEARELGVDDRVFFLGKIEMVAPLLSAADLFLIPSQSESFGLSALEALASGVPVALCDAGDVEAMAAAAIDILRDRDRWHAMSTLAARDARERFAIDDVVEQYESFYDLALAIRS